MPCFENNKLKNNSRFNGEYRLQIAIVIIPSLEAAEQFRNGLTDTTA